MRIGKKHFLGDNMFKRTLILGTIALASVTACAGQPTQSRQYNVTVTPGEGSAFTIAVPASTEESGAPYALTGQAPAPRELQWTTMQFGQSAPIQVAK
jgi:hypothetical protein